jgi:asparagine synthase (glutamine-hydrolysing)
MRHHMRISRKYLVRYYGLEPLIAEPLNRLQHAFHWSYTKDAYEGELLRSEFARRINLKEHRLETNESSNELPKTQRAAHARHLTSALIPSMFEWDNRVTTAFGLEGRHPFSDVRLVEFCLALPPEQKLANGWTRAIMRHAMAGLLPEKVRWRGGKTANSAGFFRGFRLYCRTQVQDAIEKNSDAIESYTNIDVVRRIYQRYLAQEATDGEIGQLWRVVTLALWLRFTNLSM